MERRKAMAFATAITCMLGSTTVAFASVGGGSLLGFGGTRRAGIGSVSAAQLEADNAPGVVHRTKNVYDEVVVGGSEKPSTRSVALAAARTRASQPATVLPAPPVVTPSSAAGRHRHPTRKAPSDTRRTSTRTASSPKEPAEPVQKPVQEPTTSTTSTTSPPVTTTTRPRGVPVDWPPNKPIPPMPPNCRQPQLEDNGVWNCQDD